MENKKNHELDFEPIILGIPKEHKKDIYYYLMLASWPKLFMIFFVFYLLSNLFFAGLYVIVPGSIQNNLDGSFLKAFFFSVQTMSTIGYGALSPAGVFGNIIVTIEAAFGLIGMAAATGLIFAKISRPHAKVLFSNNIVDSIFNGERCLSFRIGNARSNDISEARLSVTALMDEWSSEGHHMRRIVDLKLKRNISPFFRLSWSVFHPIDEDSPLKGDVLEGENLRAIIVTMTGHDETYSNTVYSRHNYLPKDIVKDRYFEDIMSNTSEGKLVINFDKFHELS